MVYFAIRCSEILKIFTILSKICALARTSALGQPSGTSSRLVSFPLEDRNVIVSDMVHWWPSSRRISHPIGINTEPDVNT